ncbi:MAG: DUF1571 domain-containing protein [Anaerolineaceae bacterium]|nr:DUF1571 domain-containing protein [Anaerolineaceae bacterium]
MFIALVAIALLAGCGHRVIPPAYDGAAYLARLRNEPPGGAGTKGYSLAVRALKAAEALDTYTARFEKQERIGGRLRPLEEVDVTIREDPLSIRMKWVGRVDRGKDVLYVEDRNDDRLRVYTGHKAVKLRLNLDPDSDTAMKGNRHPITDMGLLTLARGLLQGADEAAPAPKESFQYLGRSRLLGREVNLVGRRTFPAAGESHQYMLYALDAERGFPLMATRYDSDGRLVEHYCYSKVAPAADLPEKVFDFDSLGK